jgi:tetratricopeptide (TPR) repeat protein
VRVCRSACRARDQQRGTCYNLNKLHQLSRVLVVAVFLVSLALFSPPVFGQTSTDAVDARSPWNPRDSSADGSRGQIPSPYVVSVGHLRVPTKAVSHLEAAQKRFAKMQLAQTMMELDRAIDIYPGFAQAFCMKALVSLAEKDFTGSVESAAHAISLDGADAYSWVALATAYNSLHEWPEAEAAAGQALSLDPSAWQGRLELAKSFYGEAKFALALYILDQLNRDTPDVHLVRANSLMRLGRPQEAARQFSVFLEEAPGDSRGDQIRQILLRVQTAPSQSEE